MTQRDVLRVHEFDGYNIVIVECWNPQAGQVFGAYIEKGEKAHYLCGGFNCAPDCSPLWEKLKATARKIVNSYLS